MSLTSWSPASSFGSSQSSPWSFSGASSATVPLRFFSFFPLPLPFFSFTFSFSFSLALLLALESLPLPSRPLPSRPLASLPLPPLFLPSLPLPFPPSPALLTWMVRPPYSWSLNAKAFSNSAAVLNSMKAMPLGLPSSLRGILKLTISPHSAKSFLTISSVELQERPLTQAVRSLFPLPLPLSPFPLPLSPLPLSPAMFTLSLRPP
mmetsp:Transcript_5052/g.12622  ORF Transcript_5052/g.12622 Transcript_5052/m.12622 type:complete len:206 (-) Transcript_5052:350-967(-)